MNKLLLLLPFIGLLGCQKEEQPSDVAARASGRFAIQSYLFNGDTLYSSSGINKLGVDDLYMIIDRTGSNTIRVGDVSIKNGSFTNFIRNVEVKETNGVFELSQRNSIPTTYESRIDGNRFYEHSTQDGWFVALPPSYIIKTPASPALSGIIIYAQKQ